MEYVGHLYSLPKLAMILAILLALVWFGGGPMELVLAMIFLGAVFVFLLWTITEERYKINLAENHIELTGVLGNIKFIKYEKIKNIRVYEESYLGHYINLEITTENSEQALHRIQRFKDYKKMLRELQDRYGKNIEGLSEVIEQQ